MQNSITTHLPAWAGSEMSSRETESMGREINIKLQQIGLHTALLYRDSINLVITGWLV